MIEQILSTVQNVVKSQLRIIDKMVEIFRASPAVGGPVTFKILERGRVDFVVIK